MNFRIAALALSLAALPAAAGAQQIAITFDDLPAHSSLPPGTTRLEIANAIIAGLKSAGVPPTYGFVNAMHLDKDPNGTAGVLEAWRAAGNPLGNHGYSHLNLNSTPEAQWEADVLKNEPRIDPLMKGADSKWLRFPFLGEGDTQEKRAAVRTFLHAHGYRIAGVTMTFGDYAYNAPYARCVASHDTAAITQMEAAYLAGAEAALDRSRTLAKTVYGHDIPYVLLMHIGAFDARMINRLLPLYKSKGVTFVSLEQAERDPFYKFDTDVSLPPGIDTLDAANSAAGHPYLKPIPAPLDLERLCR